MDQVIEFFKKLFDSSDWPPRWHCGRWTEFHGWLYIISDLLIWSAYFTIPIVIIRYISKKQGIRFTRLYFLFAAFILACGATHFLDAIAFWIPAYRLNALVRLITGALSWITVFYLVKLLPAAFSLKSQRELETEIAQRKKAEEQVRESEEQVQTIFDAAPDAVIVIDESGKIIKWNPKAEALFGWKENEVTGKLLTETIIPDRFRETHTKGLKHFLRTGEGPLLGKVIETRAITKNNTELDVALNIAATPKIKGGYLFIGFVRDITEQRKAELQIQKQKQDIQDFMDSMSTLSVKLATDGKILMVNKIALQASGLSMEELLKTNFTEGQWWTFDPEVHSRVRDAFKKACSGIAINYDENIFVFGQALTIDFSLIPILNPDGSVDYIVGEGRDITAQKKAEEKIKESEEKLSMLFNSIDEGFCIIEMIFDEQKKPVDYRFLVINPSFEKQTGLRDAVGKRMREFAPNHEEHWFETYGRIALTGESIRFENRAEQLHRWYDVYAFRFGEPKNLQVAILFNDITDRKQTEETITQMNMELEKRVEEKTKEIIQSEKKFRNLIENSTDIISLTDENFKSLYRSPYAERVTGWTNEEREKLGGIELFHSDDFARMKIAMNEILKIPYKQFHLTFRHRHKEGHYIWLDGMMTNMLHDDTIKAIVFNLRDITEGKKAEEQIVQSEIKYRNLFENNPMPIWVIDTSSFKFLDVNEAAIRHYGYSREEFLSMTTLDIRPGSEKERFLNLNLSAQSNSYQPEIWKHLKKDNSIIYVEVIGHNIIFEGKPARLVLSNDVTERIKMEEMLKESFKETSDYKYALDESSIVAITDQKGIIKYVNDNFCKISKYSREELIGQDHRIINSAYHPKEFIRNLWATIANGKIWKGELKNKAKDGTIYWVDTTIIPFLNEEGKPYQYVAIRADITERKQAEQAFNESQQLLSAIIDNSTAVIYVKNLQGQYLLVNRRFSELFHLGQEAVLGKTDYDFFPKDEADAFRQMDMRTAAASHALTEEEKVPQDDGLHTYISVKSTLRDEKGKPYAIFGISTDITGVKVVEENLRKSLREISDYKFALDESSIVAITDQKGIIKHANDNFCKISKYSRGELIGQDHRIINSGYHSKEFIRNLWVTIANGKIWEGELKNKAKDGTIYWVDTTIIPFLNEEGKPYQYVAIRADITERKQTEENLQKSLKEIKDYQYALDESSIVAITDQKGIIKHANDNFCKISKYSREELIGQDHRIINSGYHPKEVIRNLWVTIANGKIWKGELKNKAKDGTIYWVDTTIIPFLNEEGKPYQYVAIRADITERKQAEENLEKSLKEIRDYKYALDESSIVVITDQKGIIKYANDNFCKISKYGVKELIGQDHRIINSAHHPKEFIRNLWVTIANGKIWKGELKNKAKDGTIYWVDTTIIPFLNEEGKPYQYVAIRADITERKQVEEDMKATLKEISDYKYALDESSIIAITDQKGVIKYVNENFCRISKYSREQLIGQDHRIINSGYHPKEFIRNLWVTIANGEIWKGELKNKAKDGSIYWVDTTIVPFLNENGKPYQYVAIRADITERKSSEETIVKTLEEKNIILESIGDAFFAVDKTWTVTYWNRIAEIALGISKQKIIGKNLWEIFSDSIDSKSYRKYHQAIDTNHVVHFEDYYPALNKWYEISAYPSENGLSVYFKDVTERQKADKEIKRLNTELEVKVIKRTEELQAANSEMEAFTYSVSHDLRAPLRGIVGFTSILEEDYASQLDNEAKRITSVIRNNTLKMGRLIDDLLTFSRTGRQELVKTGVDTKSMVTEIVNDLLLQNKGSNIISCDIRALPDIKADQNTIRQVWINLISNAIKYSAIRAHPSIEIGSKQENGQVVFYVKDNGVGFDENYKHKLFKVFQRLHSSEEFEGTGVGLALVEKIVSRHGGKVWAESKKGKGACFSFTLPVSL